MTMTEIMECFLDKKKMRKKDWKKGEYVELKEEGFIKSDGEGVSLVFSDPDDWEEKKDWKDPNNWVRHLCFFWNKGDNWKSIGLLMVYDRRGTEKKRFYSAGNWYECCRPVKWEELSDYVIKRECDGCK